MRKILLLSCLTLLFSSGARANEDWGMWWSSTFQTDFGGSKYLAFLEVQPRLKNNSGDLSQVLVRPLLGYKVTKDLSLWLGYTWQGEYSKKLDDKFSNATNDLVEQLQWSHDLSPEWNFQYRLRFEQRFFADADVGYRVRQRFRFTYAVPETNIYLISFDELFLYLNNLNDSKRESQVQQGINQNRAYIGAGYKFNKHLNVDTGYQLQYVNNYGRQDLFNHVWLTNINVKF